MQSFLVVFLGGGLGSVIRFSLNKWISSLHTQHFPWGTLTVNVAACLIVGIVVGWADHKQIVSPSLRLFWTIGFCGGFSTFSTFSIETLELIQNRFTASSLVYMIASLSLCVGATYGGLLLGENF
jgi:CrcB protein